MIIHEIDIAQQFSPYPIGRDKNDSDVNGERFRREFLVPTLKLVDAEPDATVTIRLDGLQSISSSFLEEAFGGLVRFEGFTSNWLKKHLKFKYDRNGLKVAEMSIWQYINQADANAR